MKKSFPLLLLLGVIAFMTTSCGSKKTILTLSSIQGEWNILKVNGDSVKSDIEPFIGFNISDNMIYGNSGCNNFNAMLNVDSLKPGKMSFGEVASTRMMCKDMTTEQAIMTALTEVTKYATVSDSPEKISLINKEGKQVMLLEKREIKPISLSELSGEWNIETIRENDIIGTLEVPPFLGFDSKENRIYGNVGCNTINGEIVQDADKVNSLKFNNIASTELLCPDMDTEKIVLECLNATTSFTRDANGDIILLDANGDELLFLVRK